LHPKGDEIKLKKADAMKTGLTAREERKTAPVILSCGVTVLSVTVAWSIAKWLQIQYNYEPFAAFLCAMMVCTWFGGVKQGLFALALSLLAFHFYFLIPIYPQGMEKEIPRLLVTALTSLFVVLLTASHRSGTEALRESELQARRLVETMPIAVYVCDKSGLIQSYNHHAVELWGREPKLGDPAQRHCGSLRLYSPGGKLVLHENSKMAEVLRTGIQARDLEVVIERPDGSRITVLVNISPLRNSEGELIGAVNCFQDISPRKQAEEVLQNSYAQLRALSARLQSVREEEATRMAREIHDDLGQKLTGLKMDLLRAEQQIEELESSQEINSLLETVVSATALTDNITVSVQEIATELRPSVLDKLGLAPALEYEALSFERRTGIHCEVRLPETEVILSNERATALFRIVQESLTNVTRHAHAENVMVELQAEADSLVLKVQDDGRGITETDIVRPESLGLLGMKERAELLGGEIAFQRNLNQTGTVVTVRIPQTKEPASCGC